MDHEERSAVWAGQEEEEGHIRTRELHLCMREIVE